MAETGCRRPRVGEAPRRRLHKYHPRTDRYAYIISLTECCWLVENKAILSSLWDDERKLPVNVFKIHQNRH